MKETLCKACGKQYNKKEFGQLKLVNAKAEINPIVSWNVVQVRCNCGEIIYRESTRFPKKAV